MSAPGAKDRALWIALSRVKGLGGVSFKKLAARFADPTQVAGSLFNTAYRMKVKNLGKLSAKAWTRQQMDRLGIGTTMDQFRWGTKTVRLPPSQAKLKELKE